MKKIEAIITRSSDGTYSVHCANEPFSGMGSTAAEAKADMMEQMRFFKQTAIEDNVEYPAFLNHDFEVVYKFDTQSILEYYAGIISLSALERLTGINQKQLWSYLHGKTKPRKPQVDKIENALHSLGNELISISL